MRIFRSVVLFSWFLLASGLQMQLSCQPSVGSILAPFLQGGNWYLSCRCNLRTNASWYLSCIPCNYHASSTWHASCNSKNYASSTWHASCIPCNYHAILFGTHFAWGTLARFLQCKNHAMGGGVGNWSVGCVGTPRNCVSKV